MQCIEHIILLNTYIYNHLVNLFLRPYCQGDNWVRYVDRLLDMYSVNVIKYAATVKEVMSRQSIFKQHTSCRSQQYRMLNSVPLCILVPSRQ